MSCSRLPPVVSAERLATMLGEPELRIVDCRFDLDDPEYGSWAYDQGRVLGATFVDLGERLSAPVVPGQTGRHPLPTVDQLEATIRGLGIGPRTRVVAYDDFEGGFAARLWWILRWLGHDAVAVLDGGCPAWLAAGLPWDEAGPSALAPGSFVARPRPELLVEADEIIARLGQQDLCLVDARSSERHRGVREPRDPVAGCIPGSRNAFWRDNLDDRGRFLPPATLRARFEAVLGVHAPRDAIFYCGSGVTGAHDLLAVAQAGLPLPRLYWGSWSDWINEPSRPVARLAHTPGVTRGA
jgi:thiosulfate/3-mercaptopyruvate sulfurtransferase